MCGIPCNILKDDGASTNLMSISFYKEHKEKIRLSHRKVKISHSLAESNDEECMMTNAVIVKVEYHGYESSFVLADIRYDLIFGTPWHHDVQPTIEYPTRKVTINPQDNTLQETSGTVS